MTHMTLMTLRSLNGRLDVVRTKVYVINKLFLME